MVTLLVNPQELFSYLVLLPSASEIVQRIGMCLVLPQAEPVGSLMPIKALVYDAVLSESLRFEHTH